MPCNHQADGYWGVYFILNEWSVFTHWPGNSGPWRWTWGECILSYLMEFSHYVKHSRRFRWDFNTFISTHCRTNGVTPSSSLGSWDRSWSAVDLNVEWSLGSLSPLTEMCLRNLEKLLSQNGMSLRASRQGIWQISNTYESVFKKQTEN